MSKEISLEIHERSSRKLQLETEKYIWNCLEYGTYDPSKPSVVAFHGWCASHKILEPMAEFLSGQGNSSLILHETTPEAFQSLHTSLDEINQSPYHVIVPDIPGSGDTIIKKSSGVSLSEVAEDAGDLVHQIFPSQKIVVFGSSMGANIATRLAALHPEKIDGLVPQGLVTQTSEMAKASFILKKILTVPAITEAIVQLGIGPALFDIVMSKDPDFLMLAPVLVEQMRAVVKTLHTRTALQILNDIGEMGDVISHVQAPVTLIDGQFANVVTVKKMEKIRQKFERYIPKLDENDQVVFLKIIGQSFGKHGHNVPFTRPDAVAAEIHSFIKYLAARKRRYNIV